jgi:hypothetical protein
MKVAERNFVLVGFEVLSAVVLRRPVFWDITPCSPLEVKPLSEDHVSSCLWSKNKASKKSA